MRSVGYSGHLAASRRVPYISFVQATPDASLALIAGVMAAARPSPMSPPLLLPRLRLVAHWRSSHSLPPGWLPFPPLLPSSVRQFSRRRPLSLDGRPCSLSRTCTRNRGRRRRRCLRFRHRLMPGFITSAASASDAAAVVTSVHLRPCLRGPAYAAYASRDAALGEYDDG